mmetsp:Transcript_32144/g.37071  ORF Transcript_32144/g.37071 Transcript_32144/m.37071 type:complete len:112 (+) Transcript_32144:46-381(+)
MDPLYVPYPAQDTRYRNEEGTVDPTAASVNMTTSQEPEMRKRVGGQIHWDGSTCNVIGNTDLNAEPKRRESFHSDELIAEEKFYKVFTVVVGCLMLLVLLGLAGAVLGNPS